MAVRKNQKNLTKAEWTALIAAIRAMHGTGAPAPAYRRFVAVHVSAMDGSHMDWAVHSMRMGGMQMRGRNFLSWHRLLLKHFEARLQAVDPTVSVPYWDAITDRKIPAPLADAALLNELSVRRAWDPTQLADPADLAAVKSYTGSFTGFQTLLEGAVHGGTHNAVGGDMAGSASPTDPLFWLHHASMDKVWADWQATPNGKKPPNVAEILQPANLEPGVPFGVAVSTLLKISDLGYSYA